MMVVALIFALFSPTEKNDELLLRRLEDDMQMIEVVEEREQKQELIEEVRSIMSSYIFPMRVPSNERALLLVHTFFQDLYSLENHFKKSTFDHLQRTYMQIKNFVDKEQIYERKPWEKRSGYSAPKPWKKRHCQKNDRQNRRDLGR